MPLSLKRDNNGTLSAKHIEFQVFLMIFVIMLTRKPTFIIIAFVMAAVYLGYFISSFFAHASFNDLRNRVVGSRLAADNKNPYQYKFDPEKDSTSLLDPYERRQWTVNGNTVTPTALLLAHPVHVLPQYKINAWWLWISVELGLIIIALIASNNRSIWWSILSLLVLCSISFKFHLFKGQMYIVYTFFAILATTSFLRKYVWATLLLAALLCCLRPNMLLLCFPIFYAYNRHWLKIIACFGLWFLLPMFVFHNVQIWPQYTNAMQAHGYENFGQVPELKLKNIAIPTVLEGQTIVANAQAIAIEQELSPDIASIQKLAFDNGIHLHSAHLIILLLLVLSSFYIFIFGVKKPKQIDASLLLFAALCYCISDYFLPAVRFNYNFVHVLIPLFVVSTMPVVINRTAYLLIGLGIFLQIFKLSFIPECYTVGELLVLLGLAFILRQYKQSV